MAGAGKDKVDVITRELPKFIREFKERTGQSINAAPDINSKRPPAKDQESDDDDDLGKDGEAPVICLSEDVTEEEAYAFTKEKFGEDAVSKNSLKRKQDEDGELECEKLMYKKPTKEPKESKKSTKKSEMPKVKNKTLLSFNDEEDDDT